ncbi:uncharacterized protein K452DRAFT_324357 [Aplosporella prunicola CBS 121167]|uniref:N-acetyltransferase domain-containing protein n=1 Tax=Aplosporella prunicola CBS 121167 TaxID=1176127 RepID=A0A6A6BPU0_9PEZI|nr:uncharacterized protein K452DRAFT_324357 [Aplosporella prunicola CBS 121167]KAF2145315.1 hypothetical protein K452DRAFT_324357 [Aplosporella prunicola CBS 121167]
MIQPLPATNGLRKPPYIRESTLDDATHIAELGTYVFTVTYSHSMPSYELQAYLNKAYSTRAITKDIEDPAKDVIVAVDPGDEILGFGILTRGTSDPCIDDLESKVELQRLYVHPDAHGNGIGNLLGKRMEEIAREQGFKNVWLGVWEENLIAQKAYQKWGYKRVGYRDFVIGDITQIGFIMTKSL